MTQHENNPTSAACDSSGKNCKCSSRPCPILYSVATFLLAVVCVYVVLYKTPEEATMGKIQKLFYLHLPSAINTGLACLVCFIGSIGYLMQRQSVWDDLAAAAAKVSVFFCSIVLITGMIWAHSAWTVWWVWTPRLTFSLILWLLYVVYLMIRASVESQERRAVIAAVYGLIAFLDVPLVWLSVRLMPDMHPISVQLEPAMKLTLLFCFLPVTMLAGGLLLVWYRKARKSRSGEHRSDGIDSVTPSLPVPDSQA